LACGLTIVSRLRLTSRMRSSPRSGRTGVARRLCHNSVCSNIIRAEWEPTLISDLDSVLSTAVFTTEAQLKWEFRKLPPIVTQFLGVPPPLCLVARFRANWDSSVRALFCALLPSSGPTFDTPGRTGDSPRRHPGEGRGPVFCLRCARKTGNAGRTSSGEAFPRVSIYWASSGSITGRSIQKLVPWPSWLESVIRPPCSWTMPCTIASPSPHPDGVRVKNGSNT